MIRLTTLMRFALLMALALTACQATSTPAPAPVAPTVTAGQLALVTATPSMEPTPALVIHDVALGESATIAGETFSITNWDWVPFGIAMDGWTDEPSVIVQLTPGDGSSLDEWMGLGDKPTVINDFGVAVEDQSGRVFAQILPGQALTSADRAIVYFHPWLNVAPGASSFDGQRVLNVLATNVSAQDGLVLRIDYNGERYRLAIGRVNDPFAGMFGYRDAMVAAWAYGGDYYDLISPGGRATPAEAAAAQATVDAMNLRGERVLVAVPTATPFPFPVVEPTRGSPYVAESEHAAIYARVVEAVACWGAVADEEIIAHGVDAIADCALEPPLDESGDCFHSNGLTCLFDQARNRGWYPRLVAGDLLPWSEMSQIGGTHMGYYSLPKANQPFQVEFGMHLRGVRLEAINLSDRRVLKVSEPAKLGGFVLWENGSWGRVVFDWKVPADSFRLAGLLPSR